MPIEQSKIDQELEQVGVSGLVKGEKDAKTLDPAILAQLDTLIAQQAATSPQGVKSGSFDAKLVRELMITALKLASDGRNTGELKLMTTSLKEMRYAYRVFAKYAVPHKVTIFGSARTPATHPDYQSAVIFGRLMAEAGWMVITGAGGGIMQAGHEGPGRDASFGVAIRLPFEQSTNTVIAGDEKLIHFRYFFTRKLMFLSQAEAVVLYPGGFGTMDEGYETLTLVQTGKATMMPIVCLEGRDNGYWKDWDQTNRRLLLERKLISPEDTSLYYLAKDEADARDHIVNFYRVYHSSRYVRDDLVIRLKGTLPPADVDTLNAEFGDLVKSGVMRMSPALDAEDDHRQLPRLVFHHNRSKYGRLRMFLDRINTFKTV
jgi:uncharacterized protein (TIGR00730 family)